MYNKADWGGEVDPYIQVNFKKLTVTDNSDPVVSLVIFEWRDEQLIGLELFDSVGFFSGHHDVTK